MVRRLVLCLAVIALLTSSSKATITQGVRGSRVFPHRYSGAINIQGVKERRVFRHMYLVQNWKNDKLDVYNQYGFPIHRFRVFGYGRVREHWKYYELGMEFIFDDNSRLVKTRRFWPEDRRERFKRY